MNASTPEEIINLPLSDRERHHHSRKRIGWGVFLSRYTTEYVEMKVEDQHVKLFARLSLKLSSNVSDCDSTNSALSADDYDVPYYYRMKMASSVWRSFSEDMKEAWRERAK